MAPIVFGSNVSDQHNMKKTGTDGAVGHDCVRHQVQLTGDERQKLKAGGAAPRLPSDVRIYAVGDVHGCADLLDKLLALISADVGRRPILRPICVFLGDYIDRGSGSFEAIERLIHQSQQFESVFLKGNHEQLALAGLSDPALFEQWMRSGGLATLQSYKALTIEPKKRLSTVEMQIAFYDSLPASHIQFFRNLKNVFTIGDFLFVHAGVRPGIDLALQKDRDLLWIRNDFLSSSEDFGKVVVHGHTPVQNVDIKQNRINVDTGAYATGRLSCAVIDDQSLSVLDTD